MGDALIAWTIRLALVGYVARVAIDLGGDRSVAGQRRARLWWTWGCLFYLAHVACAFHFLHGWSQERALEHTARRTEEVVGIFWDGGLWINYVFTVLWVVDVVAWWLRPAEQAGPAAWWWTVQGVFAFMVFNATVVFGPPVWLVIGPVVGVVLGVVYWRRMRRPGVATEQT